MTTTIRLTVDSDNPHDVRMALLAIAGQPTDVVAQLHTLLTHIKDQIMANLNEVTTLLAAINDVTNALASKVDGVVAAEAGQLALIESLKAQIAAGTPVSQAQLDAIVVDLAARKASLESVSAHLSTIATDPANPVPVEPPADNGGL